MEMQERWEWIEALHEVILSTWNMDDYSSFSMWWQELLDLNNR